MSINVSKLSNDFNKVTMENYEKAGSKVAANFDAAEDMLVEAFSAKDQNEIDAIAKKLGMTEDGKTSGFTAIQIQQVAQTKYEKASRIYSMFAKIMENTHQMLMQIINKIG